MKKMVYFLAKHGGLFRLSRWFTRRDLRILAYHGIWMGEEHYGNFLYMSQEKFARRMQKLQSMKMVILGLDEALARWEAGIVPNNSVVLTIDDGWYSTYLHMLPELERHNLPATIYVTSYYTEHQFPVFGVLFDYIFSKTVVPTLDLKKLGIPHYGEITIGNKSECDRAKSIILNYASGLPREHEKQRLAIRVGEALGVNCAELIGNKIFHLVTSAQLIEMDRRGFDIQLHTHRHRVYHYGEDCLEKELKDNIDSLRRVTIKPLKHFCYPSGVNEEGFWQTLKAANVRSATTTEAGFVRGDSNIYSLPRILDGEEVSDLEFEAELSGFVEIKRRIIFLLKTVNSKVRLSNQ